VAQQLAGVRHEWRNNFLGSLEKQGEGWEEQKSCGERQRVAMNFGRFLLLRGKTVTRAWLATGKNRNEMKHVGGHSGKQEGMVTVVSWA